MKIENFKSHSIVRSSPKPKGDYRDYLDDLKSDFSGRCAYCNLSYTSITTPFEVDHFIPQKAFKNERPELLTKYSNLMLSCKKCNIAKSAQFSGDLTLPDPTNDLFYDPTIVDYNTIFYRNEMGAIDSDDEKGKEIIISLKLYRPIHILGWICEKLDACADKLQNKLDNESDPTVKPVLEKALARLNSQYRKYNRLFMTAYNDKYFSFVEPI